MEIYSFKKLKRSVAQENLYNLFQTTIADNVTINLIEYPVSREDEMRLDLVCKNIYGHSRFIDEIGFINNVLNPFSIKEGDVIWYFSPDDIDNLYYQDDEDKATNTIKQLVNPKKDTGANETIPSIAPVELNQISVDYNTNKIKIIDSFE